MINWCTLVSSVCSISVGCFINNNSFGDILTLSSILWGISSNIYSLILCMQLLVLDGIHLWIIEDTLKLLVEWVQSIFENHLFLNSCIRRISPIRHLGLILCDLSQVWSLIFDLRRRISNSCWVSLSKMKLQTLTASLLFLNRTYHTRWGLYIKAVLRYLILGFRHDQFFAIIIETSLFVGLLLNFCQFLLR